MPFHIRLGSIKKLTLEKREFFYRVPEIGGFGTKQRNFVGKECGNR